MHYSFFAIAVIATLVVVGVLATYYLKFEKLTEEEALRRAVGMAWKFWQLYSFKMPGLLVNRSISRDDLIEAGLVLRDLVVGEVADGTLSRHLAQPHPELAKVNPLRLAEEVAKRAQEYAATQNTEITHA
jgi:hypothetical protein